MKSNGIKMALLLPLLIILIFQGTFALGTLNQSTSSCFGANANPMKSSCPPGAVIAIQSFTIAYKAAALNCTLDNVVDQDQFQLCCSSIEDEDCQLTYNIEPNNAVQYIEKCNGKPSCNVMATCVLPQGCSGVPQLYPNYMHMNFYCIPETNILSNISGTITSLSLGQSVYLQSPGFNYGQKIPSGKTLTCSVHTCDMGSTLSITLWQIVMEDKWHQCQQRLIVRRSDGGIIYDWQCKDNTATPKTLQTSEQYVTIHLENTLPKDLGSFWLGFAGSSSYTKVTVSCPPRETKPCAGMSVTTDSTFTPMTTTTITTAARYSTSTSITTPPTLATVRYLTSTPTTTITTPLMSMTAGQSSNTAQSTENQTSTFTEETLSNLSTTTSFVTSTTQEHQKGPFALGTLNQSTSSCFGANAHPMKSSCPSGAIIAIQSFTIAYKAAALNCTLDNVNDQDQFQLCCSSIEEEDCQMTYNIKPNNAVQYIEKCNGKPSCNVMATCVLPQGCSRVPQLYPNYMHMNYYCIPETSILSSISGTITSSSPGQPVYLQSPGFNNVQKIPCGENLVCSVETSGNGSTVSIIIWQIVLENKWGQCEQTLIVKGSDGSIIYEWQCKDNTAMPEILQTLEQNLTIHLENTLPKDLGSFWLGFAGSSPDSRVTVSCTSETKPCPDLSTTTLQSTIVETKTLESTTVQTTTLESTTVETPGSPKGLQKEDIGIAVGGVAGFGLIACMLSIVFIRRRINKRKANQNADPDSTAQTAYRMHLPTIGETFGRMNPIYDSVSSNSTYGFFGRIAGDRGSHTRPKNPFRNSNSE